MASSCAIRPPLGLILQTPIRRPAKPTSILALSVRWQHPRESFSTSSQLCKRKTRDSNRHRGVSSLYRSGPREPLSVSNEPLPRPVDYKPQVDVDPNHGLWGFFAGKDKLMNTPAEDSAHGRAWTVEELRKKDWNDLHSLWWVCCRERNLISTANAERVRAKMGFGDHEALERDSTVRHTMRNIKHVLTERYYAWQDAYDLAMKDPEVDLSGKEPAYTLMSYVDEEVSDEDYMEEENEIREIEGGRDQAQEAEAIPAEGEQNAKTKASLSGSPETEPSSIDKEDKAKAPDNLPTSKH